MSGMWAWSVTSSLGRVRGGCDNPVAAADWVEMLLTRIPGRAQASITGPGMRQPVRIESVDGSIHPLEENSSDEQTC